MALSPQRAELAAFLRSRRARIGPEQAGLAPGLRRRTPGLRREEVAQLAGVGVTWYTWLEQGRPINASVQVLDAIARTLRLDPAECAHLYQLADVPGPPEPPEVPTLEPGVQTVLDSIDPLPAAVYNARFDLLLHNVTYGLLFPGLVNSPPGQRNALWHIFTVPDCCCSPFVNRDDELPQMVATVRAAFGRHLGEPAWTGFIRTLSAASPAFARLWSSHDVAAPGTRTKIFRHAAVGEITIASTNFGVVTTPETRMAVYTPLDARSRSRLEQLYATRPPQPTCPGHPTVTT